MVVIRNYFKTSVFIFYLQLCTTLEFSNGEVTLVENLQRCCPTNFGYRDGVCQIEDGSEGTEIPMEVELKSSNNAEANHQKRFDSRLPNCKRGSSTLSIPILESDNYTSTRGFELTEAGHLTYNNETYTSVQYCINGMDKEKLEILVCNPECKPSTTIRKCCKDGESLRDGNNRLQCLPSNGKIWRPTLYKNKNEMVKDEEQSKISTQFVYSHPSLGWCKGDAYFMYERDYPNHPKMPFRILKDGNLLIYKAQGKNWKQIPEESYCLEGISGENETTDIFESVAFVCEYMENLPEEIEKTAKIMEIYWILALFSAVFVLFTIITYLLLWDQNIHRWTLLSFFVSLFFTYIFLATMLVMQLYFAEETGSDFCWSIGVILHFSYLGTFSWLNILNFDLWRTFRNLRHSTNKTTKKLKRYILYFLTAFGVPFVIVGATIVLDFLSKADHSIPEAFVPEYGKHRCFLSPNIQPSLVFLYGPIAGLLSINLIFFLLTVRAMYQIKKATSMATRNCSSNQQSVHLFGKLFIVMGVTWIFEVITWSTHPTTIPWWYITFDVINLCHGFLIFIIFVCKTSTLRSLEQKFPKFKKLTGRLNELTATFSPKMNCCRLRVLERAPTMETTCQELEERRKSNESDVTVVGTP